MNKPSWPKVWIAAARPRTLPAALAPVAMGSAIALQDGGFHLGYALLAALGATLIQIGTNFANDYFDFQKGADTETRLGEKRATQSGWVSPGAMKLAFVGTFVCAALVAAWLVARGGWPFILIGVLSIGFGILYTGGPKPLGYLGLGDPLVLIFFGPVAVAGTSYIQTLSHSWKSAFIGLMPGLLSTAILVVNNLRDHRQDALCGKRTLAVRFGPKAARAEYVLCLLLAAAVPLVLVVGNQASIFTLLPLLAIPLGVVLTRDVFTLDGADLDPLLGRTGKLLVLVAALFCAGYRG